MIKVLLLRANESSANLGVRVLKEGTEALVERAFGPEVVVHVQNYDGGHAGLRFDRRAVLGDILRRNGPIKNVLRSYDVVIDVCGGDSFTDIYGFKRFALILYTQRASQRLGRSTVLGPQTIGPFESVIARFLARQSLRRMSLVFARDPRSADVAAALGRPSDARATDVVFALERPASAERDGILLNVSGLLWNTNRHVDSAVYRSAVERLARELVSRGHRVTLLPHVLDNPDTDNDVPASVELASRLDDSVDVYIPSSLGDVRQRLAGAELVIGSRMHACLNGISTGTPAIPWAYSRKFGPLFDDLGWRHMVDLRESEDPVRDTMRILDQNTMGDLQSQVEETLGGISHRLDGVVQELAALVRVNA